MIPFLKQLVIPIDTVVDEVRLDDSKQSIIDMTKLKIFRMVRPEEKNEKMVIIK